MGIRIVTDSGADLPAAICRALNISIVSLIVTSGGQSYDDTTLPRDDYWRMAKGAEGVKTSQPPVGAFRDAFQRLVEQGHQVLCATITSRHSGTLNSAWSAAQEFGERVKVFDTLSLSIAQGGQVVQAAEMAMRGATTEQIIGHLRSIRERTRLFIYLDSTEFLRRGGRAAKLMPHIQRLVQRLRLKPLLNVVDGELKLFGVVRSRSKGIQRIVQHLASLGPVDKLGVIHIRAQEAGEQLVSELARVSGMAQEAISLTEAGVALASHGGEGVVAAMGVLSQ